MTESAIIYEENEEQLVVPEEAVIIPRFVSNVQSVNGKTGEVILTPSDIGAMPATTVIPTKTSELTNDSDFQTSNQVESLIAVEEHARQEEDNRLQGQIDAITSSSDVVDIVGTYQELLDYDTSKLGNNDIIKVLLDSSHDDAISYFRWLKPSEEWSYIGSQGPFYTKAEIDEIMPTLVQTTGQSTTSVMSQKAVSDIIGNVEAILETLTTGSGV